MNTNRLLGFFILWLNWGSLCSQANVVINEIMYYPPTLRVEEEYIELFNPGPGDVDLSNWSFRHGIDFTFPPQTTLAANSFLVVSASPEAFSYYYETPATVLGPYDKHLSNSGEALELMDAQGLRIDDVSYKDEEGWSSTADGLGASLERIHPLMSSSYWQTWRASPPNGTPGLPNNSHVDKPFPIIFDVRQTPVLPRSTDPVRMAVWINHSKPIDRVRLYYRSEGGIYSSKEMYDDGMHNDGLLGDNIFAEEIPPYPQGTAVEFRVEAVDDAGTSGRFPINRLVDSAVYRVDDTTYSETNLPLYHVIMRTADENTLFARNPYSNDELDSSLVYNGQVYYNLGLRFRGKGDRHAIPHSYHINFSDTRYFGKIRKLLLDGPHQDQEFIGMEAFKQLGMPAPEKQFVSLVFNGQYYPTYLQIERPDKDMIERLFPDGSGNLYRGEEQANLDYRGEDPNKYRANYVKRNNVLEDDYSDIIRLCEAFSVSNDTDFPGELARHIDVRQWIRWFALKEVLMDLEGGISLERGDDYFMYHNPADDLFYMLPWDLDSILGEPFVPPHHHRTLAVQRLLRHPALAAIYYEEILRLLDVELTQDRMDRIIDRTAPSNDEARRVQLKEMYRRIREYLYSRIPQGLSIRYEKGVSAGVGVRFLAGENDFWKFFRGITQPQGGETLSWTQIDYDDSSWETGLNGFGYGDGDDRTLLDDMRDMYNSVFTRTTFEIKADEGFRALTLRVSYDDGFVAYLNGVEIARENITGIPAFDARADGDHEISDTPLSIDVDPALLHAGKNVLALIGVNIRPSSSDFSLWAVLEGQGTSTTGNTVSFTGVAPAAKTQFISVNQDSPVGVYTPWTAEWKATLPLQDGRNLFEIRAHDAAGTVVDSTSVVIYQNAQPPVDARETQGHEVWTTEQSPVVLDQNLIIPSTDSLTIKPDVLVSMPESAGIIVYGTLTVEGTFNQPVIFRHTLPNTTAGGIAVDHASGTVSLRFAHFENLGPFAFRGKSFTGAITVSNSSAAIEHCTFSPVRNICIEALQSHLVVRDCMFDAVYEGINCHSCFAVVERNTFLHLEGDSDAVDFNYELPGEPPSVIRGNFIASSEDDGIDLGYSSARVEGNFIQNCADKGISIEGTASPVLVNNIIRRVETGVAVKDQCQVLVVHNTIHEATYGVSVYEKNPGKGGAKARILNTVMWDTIQSIDCDSGSTVEVEYSNLMQMGSGLPATNFSRDPKYAVDSMIGEFYPGPDSPLIDAGMITDCQEDYRGQHRPTGPAPDIGAFEADYGTTVFDWARHP